MKHFSGIDYEHFLDDVRDMYPFSIDEAILVELIANALDAKTSLLEIRIDPEQRTFELVDNGQGMDQRGFENYHNFSMSFKRKGQGIGFAGLGAKLALKVAEKIVTETRQKEAGRRKQFWNTSEWKFERKRKAAYPVWFDSEERTLSHSGTRVKIHLKRGSSTLLNPVEVRRIILTQYLPVLVLSDFYETLRLYRRVAVLVNGELVEPAPADKAGLVKVKQSMLHRGRSRTPFALARFELHPDPLPEELQGVGISTFGKIVKRDYFKQYFSGMDRVSGIIEVPELVECLTTSKCDFRKEGTAGRKYYRFTKIAQHEFRVWLEETQLAEQKESSTGRDTQRLQRLVTRIVSEIPDLQQFYGFRSVHGALVKDSRGEFAGLPIEPAPSSEGERIQTEEERLVQEALERAAREGRVLGQGDALNASRQVRNTKLGPAIHYVEASERPDISWMEGDTVLINTAHATYRKAVEKKTIEYHNLFAVALAMLRDVPTAQEKLELLERFMSGWGKM